MMRRKIGVVLLTTVLLGGCADLNEDDWRSKRVEEEVSKISSISGVYRGVLYSRSSGEPIAPLELEIAPDIRIGESGSRLYPEQQAGIRGMLTLQGREKSVVALKSGSYNSRNGVLNAYASIQMKNGEVVEISLSGRVNDRILSGKIDSAEFPESGGVFELLRDGPLPQVDKVIGPGDEDGENLLLSYVGSGPSGSDVEMTIFVRPMSSEQGLLDLFFPIKFVDVSLYVSRDLVLLFPNARWDVRTSKLVAASMYGTSKLNLDCDSIRVADDKQGWRCVYVAPFTGPISFLFVPKPKESAQPARPVQDE